SSNPGSKRSRVARELSLLPAVLDHQIDQLDEMLAELAHPDALHAGVGALQQHREKIRGENRVTKPAGLAQSYYTFVLSDLELLDDPSRRMVRVGQLGQRVAERGSAFLHRAELGGGATAPVLKQGLRISGVLGVEILPLVFLVRDASAHPLRDELVLRVEVAVERHLVRLRRFRDRLDADAADPLLVKQITSRHQNPLANGQARPALLLRF